MEEKKNSFQTICSGIILKGGTDGSVELCVTPGTWDHSELKHTVNLKTGKGPSIEK